MRTNAVLQVLQHQDLVIIELDVMRHLDPVRCDVDVFDTYCEVDAVAELSAKSAIAVKRLARTRIV
jgi:hypothetical protein